MTPLLSGARGLPGGRADHASDPDRPHTAANIVAVLTAGHPGAIGDKLDGLSSTTPEHPEPPAQLLALTDTIGAAAITTSVTPTSLRPRTGA